MQLQVVRHTRANASRTCASSTCMMHLLVQEEYYAATSALAGRLNARPAFTCPRPACATPSQPSACRCAASLAFSLINLTRAAPSVVGSCSAQCSQIVGPIRAAPLLDHGSPRISPGEALRSPAHEGVPRPQALPHHHRPSNGGCRCAVHQHCAAPAGLCCLHSPGASAHLEKHDSNTEAACPSGRASQPRFMRT